MTPTVADLEWPRVNLGCGNDVREGWVNVDKHHPEGLGEGVLIREPGEGLSPSAQGYAVLVPSRILTYLTSLEADRVGGVLLDNVLEHIERPLIVLREVARVCRPGARVVVRVPHHRAPGAYLVTHRWLFSRESLRPVTSDRGGLESEELYRVVSRRVFRSFPGAWLLESWTGWTLPVGRPQRIEWTLEVL